jgi:hypothetical protein
MVLDIKRERERGGGGGDGAKKEIFFRRSEVNRIIKSCTEGGKLIVVVAVGPCVGVTFRSLKSPGMALECGSIVLTAIMTPSVAQSQ